MDLHENLFDSDRKRRRRNRWGASAGAVAFHGALLAAFVFASTHASSPVSAEKANTVFIARGAAPPPPPPPPKGGAAKATPQVQPKQVQLTPRTWVAPREVPTELPELRPMTSAMKEPELPEATQSLDIGSSLGDAAAGVPGGVEGGVAGGVVGGVVGGTPGGQLGGTGTGTEGTGSGGNDAPLVAEPPPPPPPPPPPAPDTSQPLRVGGNVKAPVILGRAEPAYSSTARKARIEGVVVVEAIISVSGRVKDVRVIKGLPMGLSDAAEEAVKKWRFQPGTLNGVPVATIFNLTVTFKLN